MKFPYGSRKILPMQKKALREEFGETLVDLGRKNEDIVVLDADVSSSTRTLYFAQQFPQRFFNLGIAEANMMDIAAGLATTGKIPIVSSFSFLTTMRACEQMRSSIAYTGVNVKIAGGYSGLSDSYDGPSHQSVFDLAIVRSMPNMTVLVPSDALSTRKAIYAMVQIKGPVFLRLCRNEVPLLYSENMEFKIGKGRLWREGTDVTIISTGIVLAKVLETADELQSEGISARVLELPTLKPLDEEAIVECARLTRGIVTVEEHSIIGGLGSAVTEVVTKHYPTQVQRIGIEDTFAESGPYPALLDKYIFKGDLLKRHCQELAAKKD